MQIGRVPLHSLGHLYPHSLQGRCKRPQCRVSGQHEHRTLYVIRFRNDLMVVVKEVKGLCQVECVLRQRCRLRLGCRRAGRFLTASAAPPGEDPEKLSAGATTDFLFFGSDTPIAAMSLVTSPTR